MKKQLHKHMEKSQVALSIFAAVGAVVLIVSGHGPARWFYESIIEAGEFVEPAIVMLLEL